jgi:hypothetical protein
MDLLSIEQHTGLLLYRRCASQRQLPGRRAHSQKYGWQPLLRFDREPNKQRRDEYDAANRATPVAGR